MSREGNWALYLTSDVGASVATLSFVVYNSGIFLTPLVTIRSAQLLELNKGYDVSIVVRANGDVGMYIGNEISATAYLPEARSSYPIADINIGAMMDSVAGWVSYAGSVGGICIYDRALSQAELDDPSRR